MDKVWGGEDDLVSAHAWEQDGKTRMRFIKKVSGGAGDHDMAGSMLVVWAHGQLTSFYLEDQLKYHSRKNRGVTSLGRYKTFHCLLRNGRNGGLSSIVIL